ncbi:importin subunit beta-1, partial [Striga asiatica]
LQIRPIPEDSGSLWLTMAPASDSKEDRSILSERIGNSSQIGATRGAIQTPRSIARPVSKNHSPAKYVKVGLVEIQSGIDIGVKESRYSVILQPYSCCIIVSPSLPLQALCVCGALGDSFCGGEGFTI